MGAISAPRERHDPKNHSPEGADPSELQTLYHCISDQIGKSILSGSTTHPSTGYNQPRVRYLGGQLIVTATHSDQLKIRAALTAAQKTVPSTQPGIP
jgi:hypothetical protein